MSSQEAIAAAVEWWANVLSNPAKFDNGDVLSGIFAAWAAKGLEPLSGSTLDAFREALTATLAESHPWCLGTDYDPDGILREAALSAGIPKHELGLRFPCKTMMWLEDGKVSVAHGYRAPIEVVYEDPEGGKP